MTIQFARKRTAITIILSAVFVGGWSTSGQAPGTSKVAIPKTWDDAIIPTLEVPLANPIGSPKHISADYYYKIPVTPHLQAISRLCPGPRASGVQRMVGETGSGSAVG